jgi:hypothetical protein
MSNARLALYAALLAATLCTPPATGQELEPRAYANAPVGLNFVIGGYGFLQGGVVADPTVPLENANVEVGTAVFAYARSFGLLERSAKFDIVLPYSNLDGTADYRGQKHERHVSGWNDPRLRFSINLLGAPAMSLREITRYRQDLIVGFSMLAWVPVGQYDLSRLVNIGTNRWAFKPEIGISKAAARWTFEGAVAVALYGDNGDFFGGQTRKQEPVSSIQAGVVYNFSPGLWMALSGTYYTGGRTEVDGVRGEDLQENTRVGFTLSLPINVRNSIKLYANTGVSTRTGSDFDGVGVAWQHRWGAGL